MRESAIRFVRPGDRRDAAAILGIYAPFVRDTTVSFEYSVPTLEDFMSRIQGIASVYPYVVREREGEILAYAYASRHLERAAYGWDVQTSVYAAPEARGTGEAGSLYAALFDLLAGLGYVNAYAIITLPNPVSVRFHEKSGFVAAGVHHNSGYKAGAWHDVAWMEKRLISHAGRPEPPLPVGSLSTAFCREVFARYEHMPEGEAKKGNASR
ncbi:MAG: N-acetyltransferase family protein [Deltaproteobacteria bacterium]|nr:N-acetyltransferase family protein [Deltaproteobacteria bacterium]